MTHPTAPSPFPSTSTSTPSEAPQARAGLQHCLSPRVDVIEDGQGLTLWADLPGVPKDKLQLRVEGQTLSIDAEVDLGPREGYSAHHVEARRTRYERQFTLSRELDATQVAAEFKQGVLQVRIAKVAQARARKIDVQVH